MVKARGCSCWPFFRAREQHHVRKESRPTLPSDDSHPTFMRSIVQHQPVQNFVQIQRLPQQPPANIVRSRTHEIQRQQSHRDYVADEEYDTEEVRRRNKVRIKTKISKKAILHLDEYPKSKEEQQVYKYCCPICLRYFNSILISSCCQNYVCRICIGDMAKKAKRNRNFVIKCSHCFQDDFKLEDVKPDDKIKVYTDSPLKYAKTLGEPSLVNQSDTMIMLRPNDQTIIHEQQPPIMSPSFNIQLDSSSKNHQLNLLPMLNSDDLSKRVMIGDHDDAEYESPYPKLLQLPLDQQKTNDSGNVPDLEEEKKHDIFQDYFSSKSNGITGTVDDKMRELMVSRKSLLSEKNNDLIPDAYKDRANFKSDRQLQVKMFRLSQQKHDSPMSHNLRASILKSQTPMIYDKKQLLIQDKKADWDQKLRISNPQIGQLFSVNKENRSPELIGRMIEEYGSEVRLSLHQRKIFVNNSEKHKPLENIIEAKNKRRSLALVQVSQEILSPQQDLSKFDMSNIQLRVTNSRLRVRDQ